MAKPLRKKIGPYAYGYNSGKMGFNHGLCGNNKVP